MKTAWSFVLGVVVLGLSSSEASAQKRDFSEIGGGYSGKLRIQAAPEVARGPVLMQVVPSRNGRSVRIDLQGNFILTNQFAYDTDYRITDRGRVRTSNLIVIGNESSPSLNLAASGRVSGPTKRMRMRFKKDLSGTPLNTTHILKFSRRVATVNITVVSGPQTIKISGRLRKRL